MGVLDGKHALITGGGTGIGAAIAVKLAGAGAAVSLAGRRRAPVEAVAARLPRAKAIVADVTSETETSAAVATAEDALRSRDSRLLNSQIPNAQRPTTPNLQLPT